MAQQQERNAEKMVNDVFDLNILAHESLYLSQHGDRPREQWLSKHEHLAEQLTAMDPLNDVGQATLDRSREDHAQIGSLFRRIIDNRKKLERHGGQHPLFLETEKRLVGLLLDKSESFREAVLDMAASSHELAQETQGRANLLVLILAAATVPVLLLSSALITRSITKPIARLRQGVELIGQGDLEYSIRTDAKDEIGDLSRAFDQMTHDLRKLNETLEQRVAERTADLMRANHELEHSNQELDNFAYIASHDLKEPLRGMENYAKFLLEDYADKLDEEGRRMLGSICHLADRMRELIDALLHFSRVGRLDLAVEPTNLNELLADVLEILKPVLEEDGVDVRVPRPLPTLECDRVRVREVFQNLISNAMKYNDKEEKWIDVGWEQNDGAAGEGQAVAGAITFYVRDNGIGIRQKQIGSIFQIFKRLHGRDKFGGGTGAGLTIVQKIVERHGGNISVQSTHGEGTTFRFTLKKAA